VKTNPYIRIERIKKNRVNLVRISLNILLILMQMCSKNKLGCYIS